MPQSVYSTSRTNLSYLFYGGLMPRKKAAFLNNPHHLILKSAHPSPLSVYRGFWGSRPFSKTNDFLTAHGVEPIDWQIEDI